MSSRNRHTSANRKPPLIPSKTPLAASSAALTKGIQQEIKMARDEWDAERADTTQDSPRLVELVSSIPFVEIELEDGTPRAAKFLTGLRHPDTDYNYFAVLERESAADVLASSRANDNWRLEEDKGNYVIRVQRTAETTTAGRIIYQLRRPGVVKGHRFQVGIKTEVDGQRNPLDLCLSNLEVQLSQYLGDSDGPDLTPFQARIARLIDDDAS